MARATRSILLTLTLAEWSALLAEVSVTRFKSLEAEQAKNSFVAQIAVEAFKQPSGNGRDHTARA